MCTSVVARGFVTSSPRLHQKLVDLVAELACAWASSSCFHYIYAFKCRDVSLFGTLGIASTLYLVRARRCRRVRSRRLAAI
jgi:hypothetical protein